MSRRTGVLLLCCAGLAASVITVWRGGGLGAGLATFGIVDVGISLVVLLVVVVPAMLGGDGDVESRVTRRLRAVLPAPAAKLVAQDMLLLRALFLLLTRRTPGRLLPRSVHAGYARQLLPLFLAATALDLVLLVVLHLVVSSPSWRIVLDVVGLVGLGWFLGFLASLLVYRHELAESAMRLRFSSWHDVTVTPKGALRYAIEPRPSPLTSPGRVESRLEMPINGMVNVEAICAEGFTVVSTTPRLDLGEVTSVRFWVDAPEATLDNLSRSS